METPRRVVGFKTLIAGTWQAFQLNPATGARMPWSLPGGETSVPRVLCDDGPPALRKDGAGAVAGTTAGRGLHCHPAAAVARAREWGRHGLAETGYPRPQEHDQHRPLTLICDADPRDMLFSSSFEVRATRWRTLAVWPQLDDALQACDPRWWAETPCPGEGDGLHGVAHAERVQFWAWLIGGSLAEIWSVDLRALCWAAVLHDLGRTQPGPEEDHGARSAQMAARIVPSDVDLAKVQNLCTWHNAGHFASPPEWFPELLALQDADALDLHRCMRPGPDAARFHTDAARALYDYARDYAKTGLCPFDLGIERTAAYRPERCRPAVRSAK